MSNHKKIHKKGYLTAKLTIFDWGWADRIIYKMRGKSHEKNLGLLMIDKLKEVFGISNKDMEKHEDEYYKKEVNRLQKIDWTRDEEGRIVSPYRSKKIKW